jgi:hypothetical protein
MAAQSTADSIQRYQPNRALGADGLQCRLLSFGKRWSLCFEMRTLLATATLNRATLTNTTPVQRPW